MATINYERTQEEENKLHNTITTRISCLERENYRKKKYSRIEMQNNIKKIIEEEVANS